ncbi:hypothetical protein, partial [Wolbachia endosymbiont of Pentidionis agamae]|uniref:hypothetical protein n=1 Tax=Wolbachia endosymbiont of Pentidionis agamae TaxID=3110435 RepID=UPI002FD6DE1A
TYGTYYEENHDRISTVKLVINTAFNGEAYVYDTKVKIENKLIENSTPAINILNDSGIQSTISISFPKEEMNKDGKNFSTISFNTYEISFSENSTSIKNTQTIRLQKNINNNHDANIGNSYSQPQAAKLPGGKVLVVANNLKDENAVAWVLNQDQKGQFKVLIASRGVTEKKLFQLGTLGTFFVSNQFALTQNPLKLFYSETNKQIKQNKQVDVTSFFEFNAEEVAKGVEHAKDTNQYAFGDKHGKIDRKHILFSHNAKVISFNVIPEGKIGGRFITLEENSSRKQTLSIIATESKVVSEVLTTYEPTAYITKVYVQANDRGQLTISRIDKDNNLILVTGIAPNPIKIPLDMIKTSNDFVSIINGNMDTINGIIGITTP